MKCLNNLCILGIVLNAFWHRLYCKYCVGLFGWPLAQVGVLVLCVVFFFFFLSVFLYVWWQLFYVVTLKSCRDFTYLSEKTVPQPHHPHSHSSYHSALLLAGHFHFQFLFIFVFRFIFFFWTSNQRAIKSHK